MAISFSFEDFGLSKIKVLIPFSTWPNNRNFPVVDYDYS